MLELDVLLLRYLDVHYAAAAPTDKSVFEALLELPDPELAGYLLYRKPSESPAIERLVRTLLGDAPG